MSAARTPIAATLVSVADHAGDRIPSRHVDLLYRAAELFDTVTEALKTIAETCERDERDGYHSALRTYVLEIAKPVLEQVSA
jgi:hypothetical protein